MRSMIATCVLVLGAAACGGSKTADTTDAPSPRCGDSILDGQTEQCDDGNVTSGDGCSATCQTEAPACGDGRLDAGEACDDGNVKPGDGCDIFCKVQVGYTCTGASPSVCTANPRTNPRSVIQLGGGAGSHLILKLDGSVWDWGAKNKLGNLTYNAAKANFPVEVSAGAGPADGQGYLVATSVTAGEVTNYAVDANHHVWSWGGNPEDALGDGNTTAQQAASALPVEVVTQDPSSPAFVPLGSIVSLGGRGSHTLALDSMDMSGAGARTNPVSSATTPW